MRSMHACTRVAQLQHCIIIAWLHPLLLIPNKAQYLSELCESMCQSEVCCIKLYSSCQTGNALRWRLWAPNSQNFPGGACPQTPLHGPLTRLCPLVPPHSKTTSFAYATSLHKCSESHKHHHALIGKDRVVGKTREELGNETKQQKHMSVTVYPWILTVYPWILTVYPWILTLYPYT